MAPSPWSPDSSSGDSGFPRERLAALGPTRLLGNAADLQPETPYALLVVVEGHKTFLNGPRPHELTLIVTYSSPNIPGDPKLEQLSLLSRTSLPKENEPG